MELQYCTCGCKAHESYGSEHPIDKVPIDEFMRKPGDYEGMYKFCKDCRLYYKAANKRKKDKLDALAKATDKKVAKQQGAQFMCCASVKHTAASKHPRKRVPARMFRKDPSDPKSPLVKTCSDCREHQRKICHKRKDRLTELTKQSIKTVKKKDALIHCPGERHASVSKYNRDKVPVSMFWKDPTNPKSELARICSDCRAKDCTTRNKNIQGRRDAAEKEGKFFCTGCSRNITHGARAKNLDGTPSSTCVLCKEIQNAKSKRIRGWYNEIKMDFILMSASSCQRCQHIYLKPRPGTDYVVELETYELDDELVVEYEGTIYLAEEFVVLFADQLELAVIELDHLPEQDQRARYMLLPGEDYVPKKKHVSGMTSKHAMRLEAAKCQHLCARCHVQVTDQRAVKLRPPTSIVLREKADYVDRLKHHIGGCVVCGYWNPYLLKFLDFDHKNPAEKINCIAAMVMNTKYSLDEVIAECLKCRLVCRHCHIIHTRNQRKQGIVRPGTKAKPLP